MKNLKPNVYFIFRQDKIIKKNIIKIQGKNYTTNKPNLNINQTNWPLQWEMESVWPKSLINNEVVEKFKENIESITDGKWKINVKYGVNKDIAFENIKNKKTHIIIGHSTYWNGLRPAASFFASIPFGMSRSEFLSWINFGGGRKFWEELYEPLDLFPILAGDTGMQMGGWFPKKMNNPEDFNGLKMRIEGLGGPVLEKLGLKVVNAPASKLLSMMDSGDLDACEFAVPVMDESANLHKSKKKLYYHYPGWHQPSAVFEYLLHKSLYNSLSNQQIAILNSASLQASLYFTLHLQSENELSLERMIQQGVETHAFSDRLLEHLNKLSNETLEEVCNQDEFSLEVLKSYKSFLERMRKWGPMSGSAIWKWRNKLNNNQN